MIGTLRALLVLGTCTLRRQLRSKKTLVCLLLLGLLVFDVLGVGLLRNWTPRSFGRWVVLGLLGLFFVPVVSLLYGTGALGDHREEGSLVYLLTRPLPRSGIYLVNLAAVAPLVLVFTLGGLWLLLALAAFGGEPGLLDAWEVFSPAILCSSLAYLALFHFLGVLFRHSTLIALAYVFLVEVFVGRLPGILKRVSVSFYSWSMVYDAGGDIGLRPRSHVSFVPIDGETARRVLLGMTVALVCLGAIHFARREFSEKS